MKMIVYAVEVAERPLLERYGKQFGWELTLLAEKPEQNNAAQAEGMDVVNVLSSTYITPKLLDAYRAGGVKMVVSRTVGVEHIDVAYANAVGIAVGNAPYSPASVADYAIMMMLMVLRHIKPMLLRYAGQDYTAGYLGRELPNLTVGIVGLARIENHQGAHAQPRFGLEPHAQSGSFRSCGSGGAGRAAFAQRYRVAAPDGLSGNGAFYRRGGDRKNERRRGAHQYGPRPSGE